jgi:hypothetical protein
LHNFSVSQIFGRAITRNQLRILTKSLVRWRGFSMACGRLHRIHSQVILLHQFNSRHQSISNWRATTTEREQSTSKLIVYAKFRIQRTLQHGSSYFCHWRDRTRFLNSVFSLISKASANARLRTQGFAFYDWVACCRQHRHQQKC